MHNVPHGRSLLLLALLPSVIGAWPVAAVELEMLWTQEGVFSMPESAALDLEAGFVYVSNVNEYAKDGNGFVSRISLDGATVELRWLKGLNSPTGMTLRGDRLYVVDFDELVLIDTTSGRVLARYPTADERPVLNDVAVSDEGDVYVSGSASRTIYRLEGERLEAWVRDDAVLMRANGLFVDGHRLVHGGGTWHVFDRGSGGAAPDGIMPAAPLGDVDGISSDGCGGYLVTIIDDARLWRVRASGEAGPVSEDALNGIDLDHRSGMLAMPRVGDSLTLFRAVPDCAR